MSAAADVKKAGGEASGGSGGARQHLRPVPESAPAFSKVGDDKLADAGGTSSGTGRSQRWLRRVGVGGFLFFLIKGLLWLAVPFLLTVFNGGL